MRKPSFALTAIFLLAALLAAQAWQGPETVEVQVNDAKGRPVSGARVILTFVGIPGQTGPPYVETNEKGRAVLANLAPGAWQFEVLHPDYLSFVAMVDIRRGKKPLVSASFLEAGGTSLTPVRVKFSKGNPTEASPFLQEARQPPPAPPEAPASEATATAVAQETTRPAATPPAAPAPPPTRETSPPPEAAAVERTAPEPAPRPVEPEPARSLPPLAVTAVPSTKEPTSEADSEETGEATLETGAEEIAESPAMAAQPEPAGSVMEPTRAPVATVTTPPESEARPEPEQGPEAPPAAAAVAAPGVEEPEIDPEPAAVPEPRSMETPTPEASIVETPASEEPIEQLIEPTPEPQQPTPPVEEEPARSVPPLPVPVAPGTEEPATPDEALPEVAKEEAAAQPTEIVTPELAPSAPEAPPPLPVSPAGGATPAPGPSGPSITSFKEGTCAECEAGQWSAVASSVIGAAPSGSAGCPAGVVDAVRPAALGLSNSINLELSGYLGPVAGDGARDAIHLAESDLAEPFAGSLSTYLDGSSYCQVVAIVLPKVLRIGLVRYFASDQAGRGECSPGQMCSIGDARWLGSARVERGPSSTVIFAVFENRSQDRERRAELAVFFRAPNATWKPRTTGD